MVIALTFILLILYWVLFLKYAKGWKQTEDYTPSRRPGIFVSVIIAARNEEQNISGLLASLQEQTYPATMFEIIIIDDHSTDRTAEIILSSSLTNLQYVLQDEDASSKKKAIAKGIERAGGELIITTDADCLLPPRWVETISAFYNEKKAVFIAAPVKFSYENNLLQQFQALDFMMLQGLTASGISLDLHYMCNGANLAFSKKAFFEVNGYSGIDRIATGDDMLLMHKIKKLHPGQVHYLKSTEAIVTTSPMPAWKDFFMQRKRWASKTFIYDDYRIVGVLAFVYFFNLWFFFLFFKSLMEPSFFILALIFIAVKALAEWSYLKQVASFYKEKKLLIFLFLYQPIHIFYTVFTGAWSQMGTYEWKGRKTK